MPSVGIRELKARASEIVRDVRDRHAYYIVTFRGRPVGMLSPLPEPVAPATHDPWAELEKLGKEIGRGWESPLTSVEILSQMRR
jgi:prevent-host-death family protein